MSAHDTNARRKEFKTSIIRTIERYEGKMALMATWAQAGGDDDYLQQLRKEATKLRDQLRVKGVLFGDVDEL